MCDRKNKQFALIDDDNRFFPRSHGTTGEVMGENAQRNADGDGENVKRLCEV